MDKPEIHRRDFMKYTGFGLTGMAIPGLAMGCGNGLAHAAASRTFQAIYEKVCNTVFIDTHEHMENESVRLSAGDMIGDKANDWSFLLSHYFDSDFLVAGIPWDDHQKFYSSDLDPIDKWDLFEPWWPYLKYTAYGQNVRISLQELYGIDDLNRDNVGILQEKYMELIKPGFYRKVLQEISNIESCQVNRWPFLESEMPDLLMSDLWVNGFIENISDPYGEKAGIKVRDLDDWHRVIDWWFEWYGPRSIAIKVSSAYSRNIDFIRTSREDVVPYFSKKVSGKELEPGEKKKLEDHLFWYAVDKATEMNLPVKIHTGYYAGAGYMPLNRLGGNPGAACDLCKESPDTKFVFFHIAYPYYEDMLAVAKQYPNAIMDMCWAWIVNPLASKDFLKKFILTVPLNKITCFGGDYIPVELVPGHARIARQGISLALAELVDENWISLDEALWMTDPLMHENARKLYFSGEKKAELEKINWKEINHYHSSNS